MVAVTDIRIQINRVRRKGAADNLVVVNPAAGRVRVVRADQVGVLSVRAASAPGELRMFRMFMNKVFAGRKLNQKF